MNKTFTQVVKGMTRSEKRDLVIFFNHNILLGKVNIEGYYIKLYHITFSYDSGLNVGEFKGICKEVRNDDLKLKLVFV